MDPRVGLDGCGKSRFHRDSNPGVDRPATLSRPGKWQVSGKLYGSVRNAVRRLHHQIWNIRPLPPFRDSPSKQVNTNQEMKEN